MPELVRPAAVVLLAALVGIGGLAGASVHGGAARASQSPECSEAPQDDASGLVTISEPAGAQFFVRGAAPLRVGITIAQGVVVYPADLLSTELRWGDGSASAVSAKPCGPADDYEFVGQTLGHTYDRPGEYTISWFFNISGYGAIDLPLAFVSVEAGATPTEVAPTEEGTTPTTTGTTSPAESTPTPLQQPTELPAGPGTTAPSTSTPTRSATTSTPGAPNSPVPATATPSPTSTPSGTLSAPGAGTGSSGPASGQPEIVRAIDDPGEISTDPGVIATNLVIAGMTVWVFFSSVLLDDVLTNRRQSLEARFSPLLTAVRRPLRRRGGGRPGGRARAAFEVAAVLLLTGATYSFLEPGFSFSKATAVLLVSAVVGSAGVTYACDGLEALATRRWTGTPAVVRAYPLAVAIAVASVLLSRLLHLTPGIMYGFVASSVTLVPLYLDERREGRLAAVPVMAGLVLAVGCWLAVGPVRDIGSDSFAVLAVEATLVVVFIEGIEGLAVGMVPLGVTDGGKLYRWNRWLWGALALTGAFLGWHILLGREHEYFSGLREAQSITVLIVFVAYSVLSVGLWAWLRKAD